MSLRSLLIIAGLVAVAATQAPGYLERFAPPPRADAEPMAASVEAPPPPATIGGSVTLPADRRGHFSGTFRMNGKPVEGLIDTGASLVSLPESVAKRLGFTAASLDYSHSVGTANGQTKGALVTLDRIEIGSVRVRNVTALVLKDEALSTTLVGNTFLKELSAYKVEGGQMRLVN